MDPLSHNLRNLFVDGWGVVVSLLALLLPWTPLIAWVVFWLFAVNWGKLYPVLAKGAVIGVFLLGFSMVLIWGLIAPPANGIHHFIGMHPSNFFGKTIYVTMLLTIMALCGAAQLSGACGLWFRSSADEPIDDNHRHNGRGLGEGGHTDHDRTETPHPH